jgi:hypothetical protein
MIILLTVLSLLLLMVAWILIIPVYLLIDSTRGEYMVGQPGTFTVRFFPAEGRTLDVSILGIRLPVKGRIEASGTRKPEVPTRKKRSTSKSRPLKDWMDLASRLSHCVRVDICVVDIDTDDYALNAILVPASMFVSGGRVSVKVNFVGRSLLVLKARVRLINVAWVFLLFQTKQ